MSSNKIKKTIMLIHGEEDNNSGTLNMQVFIKENLMVQTYRSNYLKIIILSICRNYSFLFILSG
jgi:hypothetical protein